MNAREVRMTSASPSAFLYEPSIQVEYWVRGGSDVATLMTHFSSRYSSPSFNSATSCSLARVASTTKYHKDYTQRTRRSIDNHLVHVSELTCPLQPRAQHAANIIQRDPLTRAHRIQYTFVQRLRSSRIRLVNRLCLCE